ncbi:MAG: hypothetical protein ACI8S6_004322 [Myxococcota bacterium]|jgi:hypothetical protein
MSRAAPPLVAVLAFIAVAEAGVFAWQWNRTQAMLRRMSDIQTISALDLNSNLSLLIMLDEDAAGLKFSDLRATQQAGARWLEDYVVRRSVDEAQATLLRGVLASYLANFAGERVARAVRAERIAERPGHIRETERFFRAVTHVLGEEEGEIFREEVTAAWSDWVP